MTKDASVVISVVVPLSDDAPILSTFISELNSVLDPRFSYFEMLLVDDGSKDNTAEAVKHLLGQVPRIRYLRLSRCFGREIAISAGLESAIGDFVAIMNPNTDPPELLPGLLERCRSGGGFVCGISSAPEQRSRLASWLAGAFHKYCRTFLGFDYKHGSTDFFILSRQVVNQITRIKDRHRFLRVFTATLGYNQDFFTYKPLRRRETHRSTPFIDEVNAAIEIAIANSRHPLRLVSRVGLLLSLLNFLYIFYVVAVYLLKREVAEGWTTSSLQNTVMFFFLFLILAVLCEYVGRILEETQDRPLYVISNESASTSVLEDSVQKNIINEPLPVYPTPDGSRSDERK
jgi:glycosyltransferase involved in cell wall biosynthesis